MNTYRILVINPGSTSTRLALYDGNKTLFFEEIKHSLDELAQFGNVIDQLNFRKDIIVGMLKENNVPLDSIDALVVRGGLLYPVQGGTYAVNELMLEHLRQGVQGQHASNLGALIARELAMGKPTYIVDPPVVDELEPIARISGMPSVPNRSIFHALNQKAAGRKAAAELGRAYEDCNLIVAHLGGGISIGAHHRGKVIDVNDALSMGPMTPERSGTVNIARLIEMCYTLPREELEEKIRGKGGLAAYFGTSDFEEILLLKDDKATLILEAMAYQIAKHITALFPAFQSEPVDALVLTGALARADEFVEQVKSFLANLKLRILVYAGELEMEALRDGALRVLEGKEKAKTYEGKK